MQLGLLQVDVGPVEPPQFTGPQPGKDRGVTNNARMRLCAAVSSRLISSGARDLDADLEPLTTFVPGLDPDRGRDVLSDVAAALSITKERFQAGEHLARHRLAHAARQQVVGEGVDFRRCQARQLMVAQPRENMHASVLPYITTVPRSRPFSSTALIQSSAAARTVIDRDTGVCIPALVSTPTLSAYSSRLSCA